MINSVGAIIGQGTRVLGVRVSTQMRGRAEQWDDASACQNKKLYVDALNFSAAFGLTAKRWDVHHAMNSVTAFVSAARGCGVEVVVFIDAGIESGEALEKWRRRRVEDVETERRGVPQGSTMCFWEIFFENSV